MALRSLWIVSKSNENNPLFFRYFPSVEFELQKLVVEKYKPLPTFDKFVKALLTALSLKHNDDSCVPYDVCNDQMLEPVYCLNFDDGNTLWPVIAIEEKDLIFCTAVLAVGATDLQDFKKWFCNNMSDLLLGLNVLHGLSECVSPQAKSRTTLDDGSFAAVLEYVSVCLPFGRPISTDFSLSKKLLMSTSNTKAKMPTWNPAAHEGRSQISLKITEHIQSLQCNLPNVNDSTTICGTISCSGSVEGSHPEISFVVISKQDWSGSVLLGETSTSMTDLNQKDSTRLSATNTVLTRITCRPVSKNPVAMYVVKDGVIPPVKGTFSMKELGNSLAAVSIHIKLLQTVKSFQSLEVVVSVPDSVYIVSSVKHKTTCGSVTVDKSNSTKNTLIWNIGNKIPSKTLEGNLDGVLKFTLRPGMMKPKDEDAEWKLLSNIYAQVNFKLAEQSYSGLKIDPQSVGTTSLSKPKCSVSAETLSGDYRLINSDNEADSLPSQAVFLQLAEELSVLKTS